MGVKNFNHQLNFSNIMSIIPKITNATATDAAVTSIAAPTNTATDSATGSNSTLTQNNFLQLLVAQIQYQDPMNPQSNTDMAAQLAQFTSLQQATDSSQSLAMLQANSLIGSNVTLQVDSNTSVSGLVTGVTMKNGAPQITVNNGSYSLSQVVSVSPYSANPTTPTTATTTSTTGSAPTSPGP